MLGNDFETPIMYQDLANYNMGLMAVPPMGITGSPYANPYANSNLLGGTSMPKQLDKDKIEIMNTKKEQDKSTFKKVLGILGVCLALGTIPVVRKSIRKAGGIGKYLKNKWTSIVNFVTGKKTKPPMGKRFKNWCSKTWNGFKNIFKRKKKISNP